jgi:ribulose-phosphate 3-epimerase
MSWLESVGAFEIEPSLYAADFARLGEQIERLMEAGTRVFHFDMGDGHFVPPVTIGPIVLESIAPRIHELGGSVDCHLMVEAPERHYKAIAQAGGDSVTIHHEACNDLRQASAAARDHGLAVGLAFNPETAPDAVAAEATHFDLVLCMSIHPGYSGQAFMPETLARVQALRRLLPDRMPIQVDGGVSDRNVQALTAAGAQLLVVGTAIFARPDPAAAYVELADSVLASTATASSIVSS